MFESIGEISFPSTEFKSCNPVLGLRTKRDMKLKLYAGIVQILLLSILAFIYIPGAVFAMSSSTQIAVEGSFIVTALRIVWPVVDGLFILMCLLSLVSIFKNTVKNSIGIIGWFIAAFLALIAGQGIADYLRISYTSNRIIVLDTVFIIGLLVYSIIYVLMLRSISEKP